MNTRNRRLTFGEAFLRGLVTNVMLLGLIMLGVGLIPWRYGL